MLEVRGISYLIDELPATAYGPDLRMIKESLHCTTVMITGSDPEQLEAAAIEALSAGLDVWLRPHLKDRPWAVLLQHLARVATVGERLRRDHPGRVTLLVGSEFSHTAPGLAPGRWSFLRLMIILRAHRLLRRRIRRRLDQLLAEAVRVARRDFAGPISYAAAGWEYEDVDWSRFDTVGVSLYRSGTDHRAYADRVTALVHDHDKPVVITEFGCGAFTGADRRGAGSFQIVRWFADPPTLRDGHPRDEQVQAAYLAELIELYRGSGIAGCFVFTFAMAGFPRREDESQDLDRAGFGVVAVTETAPAERVPKRAFHIVAECYRRFQSS